MDATPGMQGFMTPDMPEDRPSVPQGVMIVTHTHPLERWGFAWRRVIRDTDYMLRWGIKTPWLTIYLHRYHGEDGDQSPHDHPWRWWWSLVLAGWLQERRYRVMGDAVLWHVARRGSWREYWRNRLSRPVSPWPTVQPGDRVHKIELVIPGTWTLFIAGPAVRPWSFFRLRGVLAQAEDASMTYEKVPKGEDDE